MATSTINQSTTTPTNKVTAATIGAALATLISITLKHFGLDIGIEGAGALSIVLAGGLGYFTRERGQ